MLAVTQGLIQRLGVGSAGPDGDVVLTLGWDVVTNGRTVVGKYWLV